MAHRAVHLAAVPEAHLDFCWVHVHVNPRRVDLDIHRINRLAVAVQHVFIRTFCRVGDNLVAHITAIDVGKLLVGPCTCSIGHACTAPNANQRCAVWAHGCALKTNRHRIQHKVTAQHVGQTLAHEFWCCAASAASPPLLNQLAFMPDGKANARPHQCMAAHGFNAMRQFSGIGL